MDRPMVFRAYNLIAGMISLTLGLDSVISTEHNSYSSESVKVIFNNVDSFVLIIWKKNLPDNKFKKSIIITKFSWSAIILNIWVEFLFVENNQARLISRKVVSNNEFFNLPQNQIASFEYQHPPENVPNDYPGHILFLGKCSG